LAKFCLKFLTWLKIGQFSDLISLKPHLSQSLAIVENFYAEIRQKLAKNPGMMSYTYKTTKIAPPSGKIKFLFHRSKPFPALSHAKNIFAYFLS